MLESGRVVLRFVQHDYRGTTRVVLQPCCQVFERIRIRIYMLSHSIMSREPKGQRIETCHLTVLICDC